MTQFFAILIFSASILAIVAIVSIVRGWGWDATSSRLAGLSVVVLASLIIAIVEIPNDQRTPVFSLLGVVAGFIAGKSSDGGSQG